MRRAGSRFLVAAVLLIASLFAAPLLAGMASAQAAGGSCPAASGYPPTPDATIQASRTDPAVGATIEVSGVHYCADETVALTIGGHPVGTARTDAQGAFDPAVVVPGPAGGAQLCGVGASGLAADADCLTLSAASHGGAAASSTAQPGKGNGGPAVTGTDIAIIIAVGVLLVAGGVAFATAGRGRRAKSSV